MINSASNAYIIALIDDEEHRTGTIIDALNCCIQGVSHSKGVTKIVSYRDFGVFFRESSAVFSCVLITLCDKNIEVILCFHNNYIILILSSINFLKSLSKMDMRTVSKQTLIGVDLKLRPLPSFEHILASIVPISELSIAQVIQRLLFLDSPRSIANAGDSQIPQLLLPNRTLSAASESFNGRNNDSVCFPISTERVKSQRKSAVAAMERLRSCAAADVIGGTDSDSDFGSDESSVQPKRKNNSNKRLCTIHDDGAIRNGGHSIQNTHSNIDKSLSGESFGFGNDYVPDNTISSSFGVCRKSTRSAEVMNPAFRNIAETSKVVVYCSTGSPELEIKCHNSSFQANFMTDTAPILTFAELFGPATSAAAVEKIHQTALHGGSQSTFINLYRKDRTALCCFVTLLMMPSNSIAASDVASLKYVGILSIRSASVVGNMKLAYVLPPPDIVNNIGVNSSQQQSFSSHHQNSLKYFRRVGLDRVVE